MEFPAAWQNPAWIVLQNTPCAFTGLCVHVYCHNRAIGISLWHDSMILLWIWMEWKREIQANESYKNRPDCGTSEELRLRE